ncbi:putative homoserine dehydrogenase [Candidatus Tremblaya phenacola PAVE]|nr:putative homoserine dehydrogenase [Candidatus Tremblaya phenacola PAVE]
MVSWFKNRRALRQRARLDIRLGIILVRTLCGQDSKLVRCCFTANIKHLLSDPRLPILVEVLGGTNVARRLAHSTTQKKKRLVTANKTLLACYNFEVGAQIERFLIEAAVGGGMPIINVIRRDLVINQLGLISGIINGTTNWLLSETAKSLMPLRRLLFEAVRRGYAEQDSSSDVDGADSAQKINILSAQSSGSYHKIRCIRASGIRYVRQQDILFGKELGFQTKLLSSFKMVGVEVCCLVQPTLVFKHLPFVLVGGTTNSILLVGSNIGKVWLSGRGAGALPTSSSVFADFGSFESNNQYFRCPQMFCKRKQPLLYQHTATLCNIHYFRTKKLRGWGDLFLLVGGMLAVGSVITIRPILNSSFLLVESGCTVGDVRAILKSRNYEVCWGGLV